MIVDGNVELCPTSEALTGTTAFTAADVVAWLDRPWSVLGQTRPIGRALVHASPGGLRSDRDEPEHHAHVLAQVRASPSRLLGSVTVNPMLPVDVTVASLRRLVTSEGFAAVSLHPPAHGYLVHRVTDRLGPLLEEVAALDVPVFVETGDPPFGFPVLVGYVAEAHPSVRFVLRNLGTGSVSYAREAVYVARCLENVFLEVGPGATAGLKAAVEVLGPSRLVFGSGLPRRDPGVVLAAIDALAADAPVGLGCDARALEGMLGANLAELLGCGRA